MQVAVAQRSEPGVASDFSVYSDFYKPSKSGHYIAGLDGLRAISVAIVVFAHAGLSSIIPGGFGVTVFFFISGFLITNLLISEWAHDDINLKNFYMRRYLRLSPELFFFIALGTVVNLAFFDIRFVDVLAGLFYFTNYLDIVALNPVETPFNFSHFWSLAVEEHFYLLVPLLMVAFGRNLQRYTMVIVLICLAVPFYRWYASINFFPEHLTGGASAYTYYASEARLDSILYGCLMAMLARFHGHLLPRLRNGPALAILVVSLAVIAASFLYRDYHFRSVWRYSIQGLALMAIFYALYFSALGAMILKPLEAGIFRFLGRMSYGIYIWHLSVIYGLGIALVALGLPSTGIVAATLIGIATLAISAVVANLSATYILGAVADMRRRYGSRPVEAA